MPSMDLMYLLHFFSSYIHCDTYKELLQCQVRERAEQSDQVWFRKSGSLYDPFHPYFILGALCDQPGMEHVVFGLDNPDVPPIGPECVDSIYKLFQGFGESSNAPIYLISEEFMLHTDKRLLLKTSTFLDTRRSFTEEITSAASSKILTAWVDIKYYPAPPRSGTLALWTPLPCFPEHSFPYVFCLICSIHHWL